MNKLQKCNKKNALYFTAVVVVLSSSLTFAVPDSTAKANAGKANAPAAQKSLTSSVKQIVFEEQKIEGKIRRPQLVLIKADQRPDFGPMVMQGRGKSKNVAASIDRNLIEEATYKGAFKFEGTKIVNITP